MKGEIAKCLPRHLTPERMTRVALSAVRTTRNLANCDQQSFAACIMSASAMGLEPNTPAGECYLIPRRNKAGGYECTLMVGYQGLLRLARNSGEIADIYAVTVRDGDHFVQTLGLHRTLEHIPSADPGRASRPVTHAYAVARLKGSVEPTFVVLDRSEIEQRKRRGSSGQSESSPWSTDFAAMAEKSAVRALYRWLPRSAEMQHAYDMEIAEETAGAKLEAVQRRPDYAAIAAGEAPVAQLPQASEELVDDLEG
jgi:recombination protein RecT